MARATAPTTETIVEGECLASLAERLGINAKTLWDHPDNAALKNKRGRPDVLVPGDSVSIPAPVEKENASSLDRRYVCRRRGIPAVYRQRLLLDGEAVRHASYELRVSGEVLCGSTDSNGCLEEFVPTGAKEGVLRVASLALTLHVSFTALAPADGDAGARQRLANLGYRQAADTGDDPAQAWAQAVRAFQENRRLEVTGTLDDHTRAALEAAHDFPAEGGTHA